MILQYLSRPLDLRQCWDRAIAFSTKDFSLVNGFPNSDQVENMYDRAVKRHNLTMIRYPTEVSHYTLISEEISRKSIISNGDKFVNTGLSDLSYRRLKYSPTLLFTHILVDLWRSRNFYHCFNKCAVYHLKLFLHRWSAWRIPRALFIYLFNQLFSFFPCCLFIVMFCQEVNEHNDPHVTKEKRRNVPTKSSWLVPRNLCKFTQWRRIKMPYNLKTFSVMYY